MYELKNKLDYAKTVQKIESAGGFKVDLSKYNPRNAFPTKRNRKNFNAYYLTNGEMPMGIQHETWIFENAAFGIKKPLKDLPGFNSKNVYFQSQTFVFIVSEDKETITNFEVSGSGVISAFEYAIKNFHNTMKEIFGKKAWTEKSETSRDDISCEWPYE